MIWLFSTRCCIRSRIGSSVCGSMQGARALGNWKRPEYVKFDCDGAFLYIYWALRLILYFQWSLQVFWDDPGQASRDWERRSAPSREGSRPRDKESCAEAKGPFPWSEWVLSGGSIFQSFIDFALGSVGRLYNVKFTCPLPCNSIACHIQQSCSVFCTAAPCSLFLSCFFPDT